MFHDYMMLLIANIITYTWTTPTRKHIEEASASFCMVRLSTVDSIVGTNVVENIVSFRLAVSLRSPR